MRHMGIENEQKESLSGGEAKVREYAKRIIDEGEDYDSIVAGLGPTMVTSLNATLERWGYGVPAQSQNLHEAATEAENEATRKVPEEVAAYVAHIAENRPEQVQDLYRRLLENSSNEEQRMSLIAALMGDTYRNLRTADYGINPVETDVWEQAQQKEGVPTDKSDEWMYRGVFPQDDEKTVTRGSFNVTVTPELVAALDSYIASGNIKANYKFGKPETQASPQERHDAISIYFLEEPSDEALQELSEIVKPYVRGDNLLGKKISEGFYISEIGSIQSEHIEQFIETLEGLDTSFAEAVKRYAADRKGRTAMSEAQFYAMKKVAEKFGYDLTYDGETGFTISI